MPGRPPFNEALLSRGVIAQDSSGTSVEVVAAVANKKIKVWAFHININSSTTLQWKSATTALTGKVTGTDWKEGPFDVPIFQTAAGEALNLAIGSSGTLGGWIHYTVET